MSKRPVFICVSKATEKRLTEDVNITIVAYGKHTDSDKTVTMIH